MLKKMGIVFRRPALYSAQWGLKLPCWICPPGLFLRDPYFQPRWWTHCLFYVTCNSTPFLNVCCSCFSAYSMFKLNPNPALQFSLTLFLPLKSCDSLHLIFHLHTNFLLLCLWTVLKQFFGILYLF